MTPALHLQDVCSSLESAPGSDNRQANWSCSATYAHALHNNCVQRCNWDRRGPCQGAVKSQLNPVRCVQHPWLRSQGIAADKPLDSVVLQRMRKLSATNKLKKAALVVMAKSLSAVRRHQKLKLPL